MSVTRRLFAIVGLLLVSFSNSFSQSLSINNDGSTANASALLDIKSITKGLLIPRMSKTERNAIAAPANGLIVYVNAPDTVGFSFYNGTAWKWLEEKNNNSGNNWSLTGNGGTTPGTNFIGTTDNVPLAFGVNNFEHMRLTKEALLGIGNQSPVYPVDINTGQSPSYPCSNTGIRIKSPIGTPSCNFGLLLGYNDPVGGGNDAILWNYGQFEITPKTLSFGLGASLIMMRLEDNGTAGIGTGTLTPKYALDLGTGITGTNLCSRNGLRILLAGALNNDCDKGIFLGYDNLVTTNNSKISLWNFAPISGLQENFIRLGFGPDFSQSPGIGESMRIYPPGQGVGINYLNPKAMLHISNYTANITNVLPGVMVTSPLLPVSERGFYIGLGLGAAGNDGQVWNFQNAPVLFGTNNLERMRVAQNGNVGVNTSNPLAILHVADSSVLFSAAGDIPATPANVPISGNGRRMMWYPEKAAFRVGYANGVNWNKDSIGNYSFASGWDTKAIGNYSTAMGIVASATGEGAVAMGYGAQAINFNAVAIGNGATASGQFSTSIGQATTSSGNYSTSFGNLTIASGNSSTSMGWFSVASGLGSTSMGVSGVASGDFTTVMGRFSVARGYTATSMGFGNIALADYSTTMGYNTKARSANSLVIGAFNDTTNTNTLFEIGNGSANNARSNALTVLSNGNVGIGTVNPNAALQLANVTAARKIVLYDAANNDNQFSGFGLENDKVRYQIASTAGNHVFFAAANATTSNELMRIQGNGLVGIGTTNPLKQTEIIGAASATPVTLVIGNRGGFGPAAMEFVSDYGLGNQWRPGYMRSNDLGGFTGSLEFYTNGTGAGNLYGSVKGFEVRNGAALTATGAVGVFSDERLKKNIKDFTDGLNVISKINPVQFQYNNLSPFQTNEPQIGIVAQELEKVAPYMVDKNATKDFEDLRSVNNQAYIFLLINAVKEQQKQLDEQRKMIEELRRK
jgi:hypothetical protein